MSSDSFVISATIGVKCVPAALPNSTGLISITMYFLPSTYSVNNEGLAPPPISTIVALGSIWSINSFRSLGKSFHD